MLKLFQHDHKPSFQSKVTMKTFVVLSLAIVATLALPKSPLNETWVQFKLTHQKEYSSPLEEIHRQAIFNENLVKIEEHNAKYARGEVTYTKAMNRFGDMTKEEFLAFVNRGKAQRPKISEKLRIPYVESKKPRADSVDWRLDAVSDIKDQGDCGSCWSFSATGALEGQLAIQKDLMVSLSEQNLVDCSRDYGNAGCNGGYMDSAFDYIHDNGIMKEDAYPYEGVDRDCRYDPSRSVTSLTGYYDLPSGSESALEDAVSNVGPIAVAIDATAELQFYYYGIFYDETCNETDLNHGVLVVGYDSESGQDYWIVKNSWGIRWGEQGYWRQARNRGNNCGIASQASYPTL
jgi:cathepsin L